jgi:hypothetical protein
VPAYQFRAVAAVSVWTAISASELLGLISR